VIAVAGGRDHSLALRTNGTVVAWGGNSDGQASVPAGLNNVTASPPGIFIRLR
jgi:alpha-tubulin suppressor-like RCC1 family protein